MLAGDKMLSLKEHGINLYSVLAIIIALSGVCIMVSPVFHAQESKTSDTIIIIDSTFKLWNINEKALDKNFTVNIWLPGASNNSINNYIIRIDNNVTNGSFNNHFSQSFLVNVSIIKIIEITVNNKSELVATNIRVISGVTQNQIDRGSSPFTISLLPSQWNKREWRIFFSIMVSSLICSLIAYRLVIKYRKARGVIEIQ